MGTRGARLTRPIAIAVVVLMLLGGLYLGLADFGQDCVLLTYGGPIQPDEPRTSCDPPWAPSPETTVLPVLGPFANA